MEDEPPRSKACPIRQLSTRFITHSLWLTTIELLEREIEERLRAIKYSLPRLFPLALRLTQAEQYLLLGCRSGKSSHKGACYDWALLV